MSRERAARAPGEAGETKGLAMGRWDVSDKPLFWMASSALFTVNGLLSFAEGHWELAALEAGTGALALVAAASSADKARRRPGDVVGAPRTSAAETSAEE